MTPHVMHAAHMAKIVKEHFPRILTVIGGVHATAIPKQTIEEFPQFDIVALGEGERVLLEICEKFSKSEDVKTVRGIAFKDGDAVIVNPYDIAETAEAIRAAVEMAPEERAARMARMRRTVREHNIYQWAGLLLSELTRIPMEVAEAKDA